MARYNINIKKSILFPYTSNKQFANEVKKTKPFMITAKKMHRNKLSKRSTGLVH